MLVELQVTGDLCMVRLKGRFVTGIDTGYLREKTEELKKTGCRRVIADFGEVSYLDSTGIGFLIGIYTSITKCEDGRFVLSNPNHRVREVLDLTRLTSVIPIYPDEGSALDAVRGSAALKAPPAS
jgi:anti-sigma B factor antagonist